jgi:hypothetical protein
LPWKALERGTLSSKQRTQFVRAACADFRVFAKLCGPPKWAFGAENSGHDKIADATCCEERGPDGKIRIHIEAPRTGGKSGLAGQRHAAWRMARSSCSFADEPYKDASITILYTCETADKAKDAGTFVHDILSGKNGVTKVFGELVDPSSAVTEFNLIYRKSPNPQKSWATGSPKKSTQGHHPDLVYVDDVETEATTRKLSSMEKTYRWFEELQAQLKKDGEMRVMGTREHEEDLYGKLCDRADIWRIFIFTVDDSMFPTVTPEMLAVLEAGEMSPRKIACSYRNDPWPSNLRLFKRDVFHVVPFTDKIKALPTYMLTDMAGSVDKDACETVLWIVAKDAGDTLYCIDIVHGRWDPSDVMTKMVGMFERWHPRWFVIENRVITKWALPLIRATEREYGTALPYRVASGKGYRSKDHHIESMEPRFRRHRIVFCDSMPKMDISVRTMGEKKIVSGAVVNAFLKFPRGKLKDIPDALAYMDGMDEEDAPLVPRPMNVEKTWTEQPTDNPWKFGSFRSPRGGDGWRGVGNAR